MSSWGNGMSVYTVVATNNYTPRLMYEIPKLILKAWAAALSQQLMCADFHRVLGRTPKKGTN